MRLAVVSPSDSRDRMSHCATFSAARIAADAGTAVLITATPLVAEALGGAEIGTWFDAAPDRHAQGEDSALA